MRILLVKPKHIGDSLILTPTLIALKSAYPDAEIWVIVRRGCEGILAGCPAIARLLTLAGVEKHERRPGDFFRQIGIALQLLRVRFDYVFELGDGHRGRLFAMLCRTRRRYSVKTAGPLSPFEQRRFTASSSFAWETRHRVEKDFFSVAEFLPLPEPIPPLCFEKQFAKPWPPAAPLTDFCVMGVGKRQLINRWTREGWAEVGRALLERCAHVVILTGPAQDEVELATWLTSQLGPCAIATLGQTSWPQVAGLLYHARLFVGLDTAAMHLAAACQCPIVALFGPSLEHNWHPWQSSYRIVTTPDFAPHPDINLRQRHMKQRRMSDIRPTDVIAACDVLLKQTIP